MLEHFHSNIFAVFQFNENNQKAKNLIERSFSFVNNDKYSKGKSTVEKFVYNLPCNELSKILLNELNNHIGLYDLYFISDDIVTLSRNTNLKII